MSRIETGVALSGEKKRRSPAMLDELRARALRGDALDELDDGAREWIWRSLLKGVRLDEAVALAGVDDKQLARALEVIRRRYRRRIDLHKAQVVTSANGTTPAAPRIRKPIDRKTSPAPPPPAPRRSWWPFRRSA